jgi:hypothetical protein
VLRSDKGADAYVEGTPPERWKNSKGGDAYVEI